MSPIMIRPVKEQIEHDRVIRALDHLFRRKYFAVDANVGDEKKASFKAGLQTHYPDLILTAPNAAKKILAVIEVESGESVNRMEAMAEWAYFSRLRAPFQLYIPAPSIDMARRIIEDYKLSVTELWSYVSVGDDIHFHLVSHASKTFADEVQPGDTMPAMPVYIPPPPPPPPPPPAPVVEKAPKAEKTDKAEKPEKAPKVKTVDLKDDKTAAPAPAVAAAPAAPAAAAAPKVSRRQAGRQAGREAGREGARGGQVRSGKGGGARQGGRAGQEGGRGQGCEARAEACVEGGCQGWGQGEQAGAQGGQAPPEEGRVEGGQGLGRVEGGQGLAEAGEVSGEGRGEEGDRAVSRAKAQVRRHAAPAHATRQAQHRHRRALSE